MEETYLARFNSFFRSEKPSSITDELNFTNTAYFNYLGYMAIIYYIPSYTYHTSYSRYYISSLVCNISHNRLNHMLNK